MSQRANAMTTDRQAAARFYNASGVVAQNDPECAEAWRRVEPLRPHLARAITPGLRVLDLGCGAGRFVFAIEEMGALPVGIDGAAVPLSHAPRVAARRGSRARFVLGDYCALPFAPASFDAVLLINNIVECSYDNFETLVRQVRDVLAPGGRFLFSVPDREQRLPGTDPATGRQEEPAGIPGHEEVPYFGYFWTLASAKHIAARHLVQCEEHQIASGSPWYWLVYGKAGKAGGTPLTRPGAAPGSAGCAGAARSYARSPRRSRSAWGRRSRPDRP
jgi:SAM-dependent methyltransferase